MDKICFQSTVLHGYFQQVFCLIGKSLLDLQRERVELDYKNRLEIDIVLCSKKSKIVVHN